MSEREWLFSTLSDADLDGLCDRWGLDYGQLRHRLEFVAEVNKLTAAPRFDSRDAVGTRVSSGRIGELSPAERAQLDAATDNWTEDVLYPCCPLCEQGMVEALRQELVQARLARGSALPLNPEREGDSASGKGGRPGVGPADSQPTYFADISSYVLFDQLTARGWGPIAAGNFCASLVNISEGRNHAGS